VSQADPVTGPGDGKRLASATSNLALRVCSAAVLAPLAVLAAYLGGLLFAVFWGAAAIAVLWEWTSLVAGRNHRMMLSACGSALAIAAVVHWLGRPITAILIVGLGAFAAAIFVPGAQRRWVTGGVGYAGAMLIAPLILRTDAKFGFLAMLFLFAVVWSTDIFGYIAGRAVGGPKLVPAISPNKTWAGAIGGAAGAVIVAVAVVYAFGLSDLGVIGALALVLSVVAQVGDILESWVKRRFGAKDAGQLIPGHGGVMDRLDGFWAAALVGALIGLSRGGFDAAARGLLVW
jgi:phosphatidate cytidylyltransferase